MLFSFYYIFVSVSGYELRIYYIICFFCLGKPVCVIWLQAYKGGVLWLQALKGGVLRLQALQGGVGPAERQAGGQYGQWTLLRL